MTMARPPRTYQGRTSTGYPIFATQGEAGVAAAVSELNSLPYAIRPAAQDDDFLFVSRSGFVFFFVGGIKIWCEAFKFGGAGVHALVHRLDFVLLAEVANFFLITFAAQTPGSSEASVGESHALGIAQNLGWNGLERMLLDLELHIINFF